MNLNNLEVDFQIKLQLYKIYFYGGGTRGVNAGNQCADYINDFITSINTIYMKSILTNFTNSNVNTDFIDLMDIENPALWSFNEKISLFNYLRELN